MPAFHTRRNIVIGLCSAPLAPLSAFAQGALTPQAGTDYTVLEHPQPVESGDKVEVLEFFQYSCPHCYAYTPVLNAWRKHLAPDVEYRRVPIAFDPSVQLHVQLYYTLDALNRVDEFHDKVFAAFHVNHRQLAEANDIADFMAANGIDRAQWMSTFNSFSVATRTMQAKKIAAAYEITGTPTMACDGKYLTAPSMMRGDRAHNGEMARGASLVVLDYLIDRARHERGRGGKKK
jgi:protein dithiol oxidoreductase (disulfide-forming)